MAKDALVEFVRANQAGLSGFTRRDRHDRGEDCGTRRLDRAFGQRSLGGDAQIAARITEGAVHAVIFFRDPMGKHPHEPDINMLLRQCDVHNIPLATNAATASLLIGSHAFGS